MVLPGKAKMSMITVYTTSEYGEREYAGRFDIEKAESVDEDTRWDGSNNVGLVSRSQWVHETLHRTAGERWVVERRSSYWGDEDTYTYIDDDAAERWLDISASGGDAESAAMRAKFFGEPVERGPRFGRPRIGSAVELILPDEVLAAAEAHAATHGQTRADVLREAIQAGRALIAW